MITILLGVYFFLNLFGGDAIDICTISTEISSILYLEHLPSIPIPRKKTAFGWDRVTTIGPSWLRTAIRHAFKSSVVQAVFGMGTGGGRRPGWVMMGPSSPRSPQEKPLLEPPVGAKNFEFLTE